MQITEPIPTDPQVIEKNCKKFSKKLQKTRKQAEELQQQFFDELIATVAAQKNIKCKDKEKRIRIYRALQCQKKRFRRINRNIHPKTQSSLTRIEVGKVLDYIHPKTGKVVSIRNTKIIDSKSKLEQAIIGQNKKHFAPSHGDPLHHTPSI